jgi:hypothetical protein
MGYSLRHQINFYIPTLAHLQRKVKKMDCVNGNIYTVFISSHLLLLATQLAYFEFLGLVIGKALYEGILLDVAFAEFFLKKCLGKINYCKSNERGDLKMKMIATKAYQQIFFIFIP